MKLNHSTHHDPLFGRSKKQTKKNNVRQGHDTPHGPLFFFQYSIFKNIVILGGQYITD